MRACKRARRTPVGAEAATEECVVDQNHTRDLRGMADSIQARDEPAYRKSDQDIRSLNLRSLEQLVAIR